MPPGVEKNNKKTKQKLKTPINEQLKGGKKKVIPSSSRECVHCELCISHFTKLWLSVLKQPPSFPSLQHVSVLSQDEQDNTATTHCFPASSIPTPPCWRLSSHALQPEPACSLCWTLAQPRRDSGREGHCTGKRLFAAKTLPKSLRYSRQREADRHPDWGALPGLHPGLVQEDPRLLSTWRIRDVLSSAC